jgi:cell division protein FtsQ
MKRPESVITRGLFRRNKKKNRRLESKPDHTGVFRGMLRTVALGAGVLFAFGATFGLVYGFVAVKRSERLALHHLELDGAVRADREELLTYTGLHVGDAMLDLDLDGIALQLRRHPWIESAQVRRELPDTIRITVKEHTPALLVAVGDVYVASDEGALFLRLSANDHLLFPVLTGLSRDDVAHHPDESRARVREAIALADAAAAELAPFRGRLDELHWDTDLGWSIVMSPSGDEQIAARLHLGKEPMRRLSLASTAYKRLTALGKHPHDIFADGQKHDRRIQARLYSAPELKGPPTFVAVAN